MSIERALAGSRGGRVRALLGDRRTAILLLTIALGAIAVVVAWDRPRGVSPDQTAAAPGPPAKEFHVAAEGNPEGDGTRERPWDLQTALAHPDGVRPGDTIWVHSGVYSGLFESRLQGEPERPIFVRVPLGERATIDTGERTGGAGLKVFGADTWYWGLEIMSSNPVRKSNETGSWGSGSIGRADGIDTFGTRNKYINLIVHDTRQGFGLWSDEINPELHGCLIYNNGWTSADRGHGHGVYAQNRFGVKEITDNIHFGGFAMGFRVVGSDAAYGKGFRFRGNIAFESGVLNQGLEGTWSNFFISMGSGAEDILYEDNHSYYRPEDSSGHSSIGYVYTNAQGDVTVRNNYWIGGRNPLELRNWRHATVTGNTIYAGENKLHTVVYEGAEPDRTPYVWDDNRYFGVGSFSYEGAKQTFEEWKASSGFDKSSKHSPRKPQEPWVFVRPNRYEAKRANVVVYNWPKEESVEIDLSAVLAVGDRFLVRDAFNYFAEPAEALVYDGKPVPVTMTGRTMVKPIGETPYVPTHPGPEFGVFVITEAPPPGAATVETEQAAQP